MPPLETNNYFKALLPGSGEDYFFFDDRNDIETQRQYARALARMHRNQDYQLSVFRKVLRLPVLEIGQPIRLPAF